MVLALDRAGLVGGEIGATHHGAFDLSYLRHVPGMVVMAPKDLTELAAMLRTVLGIGTAPVRCAIPAASARILPRAFPRLCRWVRPRCFGRERAWPCLRPASWPDEPSKAADLLAQQGLNPWVLNARFIKPLDEELLCEVAKGCEHVVTLEENVVAGGFGSAVLELFAQRGIVVSTLLLGLPDEFVEHGETELLFRMVGLDAESIARRVTHFVATGAPSLAG